MATIRRADIERITSASALAELEQRLMDLALLVRTRKQLQRAKEYGTPTAEWERELVDRALVVPDAITF